VAGVSSLAYLRSHQGKHTLVVLNFSDTQEVTPTVSLDHSLAMRLQGKQRDQLTGKDISLAPGTQPGTLVFPALAAHTGWVVMFP
jgi:hypothetical protein